MSIRIKLTVIVFLFLSQIGFSQDSYQLGWLPAINLNKKLGKEYKLNLKIESRQSIYADKKINWTYQLVDFSNLISKKVGFNRSIAMGYLIRKRDDRWASRLIQQFTIFQNSSIYRMSHRFVSDQTFEEDKRIKWRLRYRISTLLPLSGQSTDRGEFYLKFNNEYLYSIQQSKNDLEIRLVYF